MELLKTVLKDVAAYVFNKIEPFAEYGLIKVTLPHML